MKPLAVICLVVAAAGVSARAASAQDDGSIKQHYEAAAGFIRSGDHERAQAEYRAFLAEALHRVANGTADAGNFDAAAPLFEKALQFSPNNNTIRFDYAKACFDADRLVKAKSLAESAAAAEPTPEARLLLARVRFHLGEFQAAKGDLEKLFADKPEFNTGYLLAKTHLLLHQETQARDVFAAMARGFGDTAQAHVYFGRAYSETDHAEQAVEEFRKAIAKDSRAPNAHYYLALTYLGHNEAAGYDRAVPELRAELQINPRDFRSHYMLGHIAFKQHDRSQAEREFLAAVESEPGDLQSLLELANLYSETNRVGDAENMARRAVAAAGDRSETLNPASQAHYLLGRLLAREGKRDEAQGEMAIVAAIQKRLGPTSAQTADARTKEAEDRKPAGGGAASEKSVALQRYVDTLKPAIADAYNNLGGISAERGEFANALEFFRQAGEWQPGLEGLDRNLGRAAFFAGRFEEAAPPLARYLAQHPDDVRTRATLGMTFFRLQQYQKVVEVLAPIASRLQADPQLSNAYTIALSKVGKKE